MKTVIVWYRNDLRIHDHPALATASEDADHVVPLFIFNKNLIKGKQSSSNRNRFLLESLQDLKKSLKNTGADLLIREGDPVAVLLDVAKETKAEAVYYTADVTPYSITRDKSVKSVLEKEDLEFRSFPGRLIVSSLDKLHTKNGKPHKVFTPFWKNWSDVTRRETAKTPQKLSLPSGVALGSLPSLDSITKKSDLSDAVQPGGETEARKRLHAFLDDKVQDYKDTNNDLGADGTSGLSPYLHFGCLSPREIEDMLPPGVGADAWHRQLCWREFYHYILFKFPDNTHQEFREKYRTMKWSTDEKLLQAWQQGQTGYPVVDAAMRQLNQEGWMHNRGRLIVGSFLTKDLWLDWQDGEAYFMKILVDGDMANNNGNWQWIASVGVDPAPVFRRLYNPASQQKTYDPENKYVKKYVPELANVPEKYIREPWKMPHDVQQECGVVIGTDYPEPIVDHAEARKYALEQFRNA